MNYIILRVIVFLIILVLTIFMIVFFRIKKVKIKIIFLLIPIIIYGGIYCSPFDNFFIKFNNVDDAFHYYFPSSIIVKKYEYEDFSFIVFYDKNPSRGDTLDVTYITKTNDRWQIDNILKKNCDSIKAINTLNEHYHISQLNLKDNNTLLIRIDYIDYKMEEPEVYDSLSSNIDVFYSKEINNIRIITLVIIFDDSNINKLNENYSIFFDKTNHKIFKK